jgi:hypothetical protein
MNYTPDQQKWIITAWSLLLVIILFNPLTFKITNILSMISPNLATTSYSGPTLFGYTLHYIVFFFIVRGMMEMKLPGTKM